MSSPVPVRGGISATAHRMGSHPQDHGWRELYRLFAHGLDHAAPHLTRVVTGHLSARPASSHSHVITMLGIAVKYTLGDSFDLLASAADVQTRLAVLEQGLARHHAQVSRILNRRQNSFTAARRFLVPQVLLGAYFAANGSPQPVNLADLGTGLGIMPRQLNSRTLYDLFSPNLAWPGGAPPFRAIPLAHRFGLDRGPMPDRAWVAACYGSSAYYADLYRELLFTLSLPEVRDTTVHYEELDLLDRQALTRFVRARHINAVNLCYVLYQLAPDARTQIIDTLRAALDAPGVILTADPPDDMARPGCVVRLYQEASSAPLRVCAVSDGHFRGHVVPLDDYDTFARSYPLATGA